MHMFTRSKLPEKWGNVHKAQPIRELGNVHRVHTIGGNVDKEQTTIELDKYWRNK